MGAIWKNVAYNFIFTLNSQINCKSSRNTQLKTFAINLILNGQTILSFHVGRHLGKSAQAHLKTFELNLILNGEKF